MRLPRIIFCLLIILQVVWYRPTSAQELITVGLTTRTGSTSLPFVIAEEKGLFKSEGLNAIVVIMQNRAVVNGVVTRNVDYGGTFSNFVGAALSNLPVRIVMSALARRIRPMLRIRKRKPKTGRMANDTRDKTKTKISR